MKIAGAALAEQIAAMPTAVAVVDTWLFIHTRSAPPSAIPPRLPAVCHPEAAPRRASGTVRASRASTAEPLVATAACATKRTAV
jgi:hypothetical protein